MYLPQSDGRNVALKLFFFVVVVADDDILFALKK